VHKLHFTGQICVTSTLFKTISSFFVQVNGARGHHGLVVQGHAVKVARHDTGSVVIRPQDLMVNHAQETPSKKEHAKRRIVKVK
jgi:hypothetical protein